MLFIIYLDLSVFSSLLPYGQPFAPAHILTIAFLDKEIIPFYTFSRIQVLKDIA